MKKTILFIMISAMLIATLSGCGNKPAESTEPKDPGQQPTAQQPVNPAPNQGITVNKINFEVLDFTKLTEDKQKLVDGLKSSRGFTAWQEDSGFIIVISSGQKSTGGYSIEVKSIEDNEGKTNITVAETAPGPNDVSTQVITYPFVIVKASGITDNFSIVNTQNERFSPIAAKSTDLLTKAEGRFIGIVDTASVEIEINGESRTFMTYDVQDSMKSINDNDMVRVEYLTNEYGQLLLKHIEKIK